MTSLPRIVYFSSVTENTKHFVDKLPFEGKRIPLRRQEEPLTVTEPYVLFVPTYGGGRGESAVPKQVIKLLNDEPTRHLCVGVIGGGNINFGEKYAIAADIVARKLGVPVLYRFELRGTETDLVAVEAGLRNSWQELVKLREEALALKA